MISFLHRHTAKSMSESRNSFYDKYSGYNSLVKNSYYNTLYELEVAFIFVILDHWSMSESKSSQKVEGPTVYISVSHMNMSHHYTRTAVITRCTI